MTELFKNKSLDVLGAQRSVLSLQRNRKLLSPAAISKLKIHKMSLAAGALPRIPLGELTALPQTHGWILGRERKGQKEGEREREGKERTKKGVGTE